MRIEKGDVEMGQCFLAGGSQPKSGSQNPSEWVADCLFLQNYIQYINSSFHFKWKS